MWYLCALLCFWCVVRFTKLDGAIGDREQSRGQDWRSASAYYAEQHLKPMQTSNLGDPDPTSNCVVRCACGHFAIYVDVWRTADALLMLPNEIAVWWFRKQKCNRDGRCPSCLTLYIWIKYAVSYVSFSFASVWWYAERALALCTRLKRLFVFSHRLI